MAQNRSKSIDRWHTVQTLDLYESLQKGLYTSLTSTTINTLFQKNECNSISSSEFISYTQHQTILLSAGKKRIMNDQDCIVSQIRVMLEQERAQAYRCMDYLSYRTEFGPDWGFEAIACCTGVDRLTAVKAISYFDRFMSTSSSDGIGLEAIQLAFVASLVIALKVESGLNVELDFVANFVTKGAYDKEEIKRMEMEVLQALEWRLSGPTPHDFVDRFLEIVPGIDAMNLAFLNQFSKAVSEASIVRYCIACQNPSVIAFSAICCSCELARSINAVDSCASQYSLQTVSGLIFADSIQESVIKTMVRIMLAIISLELSSFAARAESESMPASSDDSFSSTS